METIVETKTCRHCNIPFSITDLDLEFYEKTSPTFAGKRYLIPTPTLCPDCRQQRRLSFRNERHLYKRVCDATGKEIISTFQPGSPYIVYEQNYWWSDKWNPLDYGGDFDFSRSFFSQMSELMKAVPVMAILNDNNIASTNCDYSFDCWYASNCYFVTCAWRIQDSMYCCIAAETKDCVDCSGPLTSLENCYQCIYCKNLNHCFYLENSTSCHHCTLGFHLNGCSFCYGCTNLTNKKYLIFNQQYSKEQYEAQMLKRNVKEDQKRFDEIKKNTIYKAVYNVGCTNCIGANLIDCKDSTQIFGSLRLQNCKYYMNGDGGVNCMDIFMSGECELAYENLTCDQGFMTRFSFYSHKNSHALYSQYCFSCQNIFGCIGLRNKSYCILNKQYTKEEYEKLVPKIIEHMMKSHPNPLLGGEGILEWGEFFPSNISPFGYNETMAQEHFPLVREEVIGVPVETKDFSSGFSAQSSTPVETRFIASDSVSRGLLHGPTFNWSDYEAPFPKVEKIISADKLPDDISKIPDDILNWAIMPVGNADLRSLPPKPFRIIKPELAFYRKHNLPIPHRHPDQRHLDRMALRNPRKLFSRKCDKCGIGMQTTYSHDRPEIVYCEKCYNEAVY